MKLKVLIVDDEPLAREYLQRQVEEQGAEVVGQAQDAPRALEMVEEFRPDLVLLDIDMPGLTGLQTAAAMAELECAPHVAFVTGYCQYAIDAFEQAAIDYLLKPVTAERLAITLARATKAVTVARRAEIVRTARRDGNPRRIPIRESYSVRLVPVERIISAVAKDKAVYIRTRDGEHKTYYTLNTLEDLLPREGFLRVHSSVIVNLAIVEALNFLGNHSYSLALHGGGEMPVGRTYYPELRKRLGLDRLPTS